MAQSTYPRDDPQRRTLRLHEWPALDQQAWLAAIALVDQLEDGGAAASWSPVSKRGQVKNYGTWLAHHVRRGTLDAGMAPETRVSTAAVQNYVAELRQRNSSFSVLARIAGLASMMTVMVPTSDWGWLWDVANHLRREAVAAKPKRDRLVSSEALVDLGLALMAQAEAADGLRDDYRGSRYRDGLMIALLAARPMRLRNLTELRIGRNLVPQGAGYRLLFRRAETKTGVELDMPFPEELLPALATYLTVYRPMLLARGEVVPDLLAALAPPTESLPVLDGLWISTYGTMMAMPSIYLAIKTRTNAAFDFVVNPHRFRHCAATSAAMKDPGHARMSMALLGHTTTATGQRDYNGASATADTGHYQSSILALRDSLRHRGSTETTVTKNRLRTAAEGNRHVSPDGSFQRPGRTSGDASYRVEPGVSVGHDHGRGRIAKASAPPEPWRMRRKKGK